LATILREVPILDEIALALIFPYYTSSLTEDLHE